MSHLTKSASPSAHIIDEVLTKALFPLGLKTLSFREGVDHDGEPAWLAVVKYEEGAPPPNAQIVIDAIAESIRKLADIGDHRFLYVRHEYADGEPALDDQVGGRGSRRRSAA